MIKNKKSEYILITNYNVIFKEFDNKYFEYYIFRMINANDFGIELNICYK
jgi:hypothetical protein